MYWLTIGKKSLCEETNENGRRLQSFTISKNMNTCSMNFSHKDIHKQTWISSDRHTTNHTVHIDKRHNNSIKNVRCFRGAE